jgi:glycosyltransferase involved in cell wall biosynthesis
MPAVSVVIPTYNSAQYLAEAIDSVLAQTYKDFELLVVDDGSTDDTEELMRQYGPPVHYLRKPNGGVSTARNLGIEQSKGRYVGFLDADDTWFPEKLERQLAALADHPNFRACYSAFLRVTSELDALGIWRGSGHGSALADLLTRGNVIGSVSVVCERTLFSEVGGFDPTLSQCADWDMWVRLATRTDLLYLDEPLVTYRQHGANMSNNPALLERDSIRVLEKGFALHCLPPMLSERRRQAFARNYTVLAGTYFGARQYFDCLRCSLRAVSMDPGQFKYLAAYPLRAASRLRSQLRPDSHAAGENGYGNAL